jgi:aminopeptidase N
MRWWDDLWLNESFAEYISTLATELATRYDTVWASFANIEKTWAYRQDQLPSTHPIASDMVDLNAVRANFDGITYAKGASVLKQLVAYVGEDAFLTGLRGYFRRHEYGNTELSDFLTSLEESSGRDLQMWAKEWLQAAGVNTLRPSFEIAGDTYRSFAVGQEAPEDNPTLRSHRIAVGLYDTANGSLVRRRQVELDIVGAKTPVTALDGEPVPDLLLLNDDDLTFAKIRLDRRSFSALVDRLHLLSDPLARTLCWSAAWDMTRDAEIPARSYVDLVLGNLGGETEIGVVQSLLAQAASAINLYGDPANRVPALDRLASHALDALRESPRSGDQQLVWARCFIGSAQRDEHLAHVRALLEGTASEEGLSIDTDLRWLIVRSLAAAGVAGDEIIEREVERDPTDKGRREAAAARAARPSAEAKAEAWGALTGAPPLPYSVLRATIAGFQNAGQREILEPYRERYFEVLARIWETSELEVALGFTSGLYPRVVIDEATVDATDGYIASERPPAPLRRLLLEGRDDVQRAMRARAVDASS